MSEAEHVARAERLKQVIDWIQSDPVLYDLLELYF